MGPRHHRMVRSLPLDVCRGSSDDRKPLRYFCESLFARNQSRSSSFFLELIISLSRFLLSPSTVVRHLPSVRSDGWILHRNRYRLAAVVSASALHVRSRGPRLRSSRVRRRRPPPLAFVSSLISELIFPPPVSSATNRANNVFGIIKAQQAAGAGWLILAIVDVRPPLLPSFPPRCPRPSALTRFTDFPYDFYFFLTSHLLPPPPGRLAPLPDLGETHSPLAPPQLLLPRDPHPPLRLQVPPSFRIVAEPVVPSSRRRTNFQHRRDQP